jgi:ABC-type glycerol-3-phosphate transport system permease component
MDQISDPQLHQLALNLDDLTVAGDEGLGIIVALLVIAILVVILVFLLQHRIVIK